MAARVAVDGRQARAAPRSSFTLQMGAGPARRRRARSATPPAGPFARRSVRRLLAYVVPT